jgi:hypothetical protein
MNFTQNNLGEIVIVVAVMTATFVVVYQITTLAMGWILRNRR